MKVSIEIIPAVHVARIRHVGPYQEIGPCFMRLFQWAASIGAAPGRGISLSHDDPEIVAPANLRSDACLELETDAVPPSEIVLETLPAGRFAVYTHQGPYDGIASAYRQLFHEWLPTCTEEADNAPCREVYLNTPMDTPPEALLTELCLPLKAADLN